MALALQRSDAQCGHRLDRGDANRRLPKDPASLSRATSRYGEGLPPRSTARDPARPKDADLGTNQQREDRRRADTIGPARCVRVVRRPV